VGCLSFMATLWAVYHSWQRCGLSIIHGNAVGCLSFTATLWAVYHSWQRCGLFIIHGNAAGLAYSVPRTTETGAGGLKASP